MRMTSVGPDHLTLPRVPNFTRPERLPEFVVFSVDRLLDDPAAFDLDEFMARHGHQARPVRAAAIEGEMELRLSPPGKGARGGDRRRNGRIGNTGNPLEHLLDLPSLELQLMIVGDMLHPAAAAAGVIRADRRNTVARRGNDPDKAAPGIPPSDFGDLDIRLVPVHREGDEEDKIGNPTDAVAAEGHILDAGSDPITDLEQCTHFITPSRLLTAGPRWEAGPAPPVSFFKSS
jgi:hypothetical protein